MQRPCRIMNQTEDKSEESANPRGIDMMKTSRQTESANLNHFMESMARVFGMSRKKLDKLMFQGQAHSGLPSRSTARRRNDRSSSLAVK